MSIYPPPSILLLPLKYKYQHQQQQQLITLSCTLILIPQLQWNILITEDEEHNLTTITNIITITTNNIQIQFPLQSSNPTISFVLFGTLNQLLQCSSILTSHNSNNNSNSLNIPSTIITTTTQPSILNQKIPALLDFILNRLVLKTHDKDEMNNNPSSIAVATTEWKDLSYILTLISNRQKQQQQQQQQLSNQHHYHILDNVIGILLCMLISQYSADILSFIGEINAQYTPDNLLFNPSSSTSMKHRVEWVMAQHAPLGLKLNPQIDVVLGHAVIMFIDFWNGILSYTWLFLPSMHVFLLVISVLVSFSTIVLRIIPNLGIFSLLLVICMDIICISSIHIAVLHRFFCRILRLQLRLLGSLAYLMRGKKRNVLRNRIDTIHADGAQLVLGSMMFSILVFILQTTLAHHILILMAWACVVLVTQLLQIILNLIEFLPNEMIMWKKWQGKEFRCCMKWDEHQQGLCCYATLYSASTSSSFLDLMWISTTTWLHEYNNMKPKINLKLSTRIKEMWDALIWGKVLELS
jgi:hypothetical protein